MLRTGAVLNATGTWTRPFVPAVPGAAEFRGRQLHTAEYVAADEFAGQRVAVVGGGISKKADKFLPKLKLKTPIVAAKLQNTAGIVGAAWMAVDRRERPDPAP